MSKVVKDDNGYHVQHNGISYPFKDDKAEQVIEKYKNYPVSSVAVEVLGSSAIWGEDLTQLPKFADAVQKNVDNIVKGI